MEDYRLEKRIGHGSFGEVNICIISHEYASCSFEWQVYLAFRKHDLQPLAIKIIEIDGT